MPSVSADCIKYSVPFLLASATSFCALWDNDEAGITARNRALKEFGEEFESRFKLLPDIANSKTRLEDLFVKADLVALAIRLGFDPKVDKKKIFSSLFYSQSREEHLSSLSEKTKENFQLVSNSLRDAFAL